MSRPMTPQEKQKWDTIKDRIWQALTGDSNLLKQDMMFTWNLHKNLYGRPKSRPKMTCCIEKDVWIQLVININKAYKNE